MIFNLLALRLGYYSNIPDSSIMPIIDVDCPIPGCQFATGSVPKTISVVLLNTHAITHTAPAVANTAVHPNGAKLDRPELMWASPWKNGICSNVDGMCSRHDQALMTIQ